MSICQVPVKSAATSYTSTKAHRDSLNSLPFSASLKCMAFDFPHPLSHVPLIVCVTYPCAIEGHKRSQNKHLRNDYQLPCLQLLPVFLLSIFLFGNVVFWWASFFLMIKVSFKLASPFPYLEPCCHLGTTAISHQFYFTFFFFTGALPLPRLWVPMPRNHLTSLTESPCMSMKRWLMGRNWQRSSTLPMRMSSIYLDTNCQRMWYVTLSLPLSNLTQSPMPLYFSTPLVAHPGATLSEGSPPGEGGMLSLGMWFLWHCRHKCPRVRWRWSSWLGPVPVRLLRLDASSHRRCCRMVAAFPSPRTPPGPPGPRTRGPRLVGDGAAIETWGHTLPPLGAIQCRAHALSLSMARCPPPTCQWTSVATTF